MHTDIIDINECLENLDGCDHMCSNRPGSYTCSCHTGYRLAMDNHTCNGKLAFNGYKRVRIFLLLCSIHKIDIDECAEGIHRCEHNCSNTDGSYACRCAIGYRVGSNGYSCNGTHINLVKFSKLIGPGR